MQVPALDLARQYRSLKDEIDAAILGVLASGGYALGPEVSAFEREFAAFVGADHAIACASGSDALLLSLMALDIGPGDEVITSPFTFFATASCTVRLGARPVFADIDPETYNIDPARVAEAITAKTRAIIPVHLYGQCADMTQIGRIGADAGVAIIEDACQAVGATHNGKSAGAMGEAGCFSFYPTKNLGAAGDAGMMTTQDADLARRLRRLRVHGSDRRYCHDELGINSRMDAFQGAILRVKLKRLSAWTEARRRIAARYDDAFADTDAKTPAVPPGNEHVYYQYVVRVPDRDALAAALREDGITVETYYPVPLHVQRCFAELGYGEGSFPQAEAAARETMALPVFAEITDAEVDAVIDAVCGRLQRSSCCP